MNKIISIGLSLCLLILFSACGEQAATTTNQSPSATETATKASKKPQRERGDPVEEVIKRIEKSKVELSAEQLETIRTKAASFDFSGETRYEKRIKYKDFREEVLESVLTDEQKAQLKNKAGKKKKKRKQREDEGESED